METAPTKNRTKLIGEFSTNCYLKCTGLPRFTVEGKRHCYDAQQKHNKFESFEEATNACKNDDSCAGIWDDKCDGTKFVTCENKRDWDEISRSSCIYRKNPGKELR